MVVTLPHVVTPRGIDIAYDIVGEPSHARHVDTVVLIMGIGAQLIYWQDAFCDAIAERGYRVVRFDNRDVGMSSKMGDARPEPIRRSIARRLAGLPVEAPYTLLDMADDTVGLMDALDIDRAHVVGASMGGMIAQTLAIAHPRRVASMTSIMSHPGCRRHLLSDPRAVAVLLGRAPRSKAEAMDRAEAFYRVVGSRRGSLDVSGVRERAGRAYDRCFYPLGFARQMAAVLASGSRYAALQQLSLPALVIHGADDPLILPFGGRRTAAAIPHAALELIDGMGHDLPEAAWPRIIDAIVANARRA